jgi:hypothetical protein
MVEWWNEALKKWWSASSERKWGERVEKLGYDMIVPPELFESSQLDRILLVVSTFRGAYEGLKLCLEFNEKDSVRSMVSRILKELWGSH